MTHPTAADHSGTAPDTASTPPDAVHGAPPSQFALLRQRRFAPFFWTQFLGAGNDNLFKFALTVLLTYQLQVDWLPPAMAGLVIGALFILPFVLLSATSGQLSDKYPKELVMRFVKTLEIAIMALAAWGFSRQDVPILLGCVFLMGVHSTLFGPVKFAYLPQHLSERELTGGNGMVEMGTFVSILLGNLVGGLLIALPDVGRSAVAVSCLAVAVAGRLAAQAIPHSPAPDPQLRIEWNPLAETWRNLRLAHGNLVVFRSLLGISWMWFFGAVFLANFPALPKGVLHGDAHVASLLLVVFSVGIGIGALLCEVVSRRHVDIGLVPAGAIGMSVFGIDLYFAARGLPAVAVQGLGAFLAQPAQPPGAHHRRQQHPERAVHDRQRAGRGGHAGRRLQRARGVPGHRAAEPAGGCRRVPAGAGIPAALHHGPPHLRGADAGLAVPPGQGHPDRTRARELGGVRCRIRRRRPGAGRRRPAVHLSRGQHHPRRPAAALPRRGDEDPAAARRGRWCRWRCTTCGGRSSRGWKAARRWWGRCGAGCSPG